MLYSNIKYRKNFTYLPVLVQKALQFAAENDLVNFKTGTHEIEGKDLYVNIAEFDTQAPEDRIWEAHKQYLDLHLVLRGEEKINLRLIDEVETGIYHAEEDYLEIKAEGGSQIYLHEGDFLICNPEDAHQTGVKIYKSCNLKKAIFKIRIEAL